MTRVIVVALAVVASSAALAQPEVAPPPVTDDAAIRKALQADAAAQPAPSAPPAAAPAPAAPGGEVSGSLSAQASARPTGTGLLNPNLSVIVDGSFGYYGVHAGDFAALGVPVSGDDPSTERAFTL